MRFHVEWRPHQHQDNASPVSMSADRPKASDPTATSLRYDQSHGVKRTMNTLQRHKIPSVALPVALSIVMLAMIAVLAGCDRAEHATDSSGNRAPVGQSTGDQSPLGHVVEFDRFTLRANVGRTDILSDAMARRYGIEPAPDLVLLNVVILENRPDRQHASVSADVRAQHESLIGHAQAIEMRAIEADGHISYVGTLDASGERAFQLVIEAQPQGVDEPLRMNFEVLLDAFDVGDYE
jgi:hypothetical protein